MLKFINQLFSKNKKKKVEKPDNSSVEKSGSLVDTKLDNTKNSYINNVGMSEEEKKEKLMLLKKQGNAALAQGNLDSAEIDYRQAIKIDDKYLDARINLAWVLNSKIPFNVANIQEAKEHLLKALEINENNIDVHFIVAQTYEKLTDTDNALKSYIKALNINPEFEIARNSLYMLAVKNKKNHIVISFIEEQIQNLPSKHSLYFDLGNFYKEIDNYDSAIKAYEKYLTFDNKSSQAYNNLGAVYFKAKNPAKAVEYYKKAIELGDINMKMDATNQLLFTYNYLPEITLEDYYQQAKSYGRLLNEKYTPFTTWQKKGNKLKIGFVSGDLKYHPVAYFLMNLIKHIDKSKFEIIAYSTSTVEDNMTEKLKKYFNAFHSINIQDVEQCAKKIHNDGINILIDLAGHSHGHFAKNLHVFAMKPAPVQASWLGYFNSTGVEQIDYIMLDNYCIKPEEHKYMIEKVINLPETRLNYSAPEANTNYPTMLPALQKYYVTFGCYQSLLKINQEVLTVWAEILNQVPNSKLRIQEKSLKNNYVKEQFIKQLQLAGIQDKVILVEGVDHEQYLNSYAEIDMILDTFPFTGGTTTCEALYMGTPTLTIEGDTIIGRQTASFLKELNMLDFIAKNKQEYIQKAVMLSQDLEKLNIVRQHLRKEFLKSSICDAHNFALDFEEILESIWVEKNID